MLSQNEWIKLLPEIVKLAQAAGQRILEVYNSDDFNVETKSDNSPLTKADLASHNIICETLAAITPDIPVLSEESASIDYTVRKTWSQYWLIDPLDGTKEFIKRNGQFTVNIALISEHKPVLGVVYVPVTNTFYYAAQGDKAYLQHENTTTVIQTRNIQKPLVVVGSRSHAGEEMPKLLAKLGEHELISMGSSLKICLIAEAKADFYPRLGPTSEWDTAAAHAVLAVAGGDLQDLQGNTLLYNTKDSILNPFFMAFGDNKPTWSEYFIDIKV